MVNTRFSGTSAPPQGVIAPAYMAFALPANSALKKPLDRALTIVTGSLEWRSVEETQLRSIAMPRMARPRGFEPLTPRSVVWCSIQLSYGRP